MCDLKSRIDKVRQAIKIEITIRNTKGINSDIILNSIKRTDNLVKILDNLEAEYFYIYGTSSIKEKYHARTS